MSEHKNITLGIWVYAEPSKLQRTLESIHTHTPAPHALVLLPDGPEPAAAAALSQHHDIPQLATDRALGAPACFNRLIAYDQAKVVVFLESGVIVTRGWLERLGEALNAEPCHGLAGPSTNMAWNEQRLSGAPDAEAAAEAVEAYAAQVAQRYHGMYRSLEPLYSLGDFCYAVKREVIEAIGGSDERYTLGPCWEMDYNVRAARAGFKGIWVCGAYVHRLPLAARRIEQERRLAEENKRLYQRKFCRLRMANTHRAYATHCEGDTCVHFAPKDVIQLRSPLAEEKQPEPPTPSQYTVQVPQPASPPAPPAKDEVPLVSCIMPTYNRRLFVPQAIQYFLRQDYPHKELVIVDDGSDPVDELIPPHAPIRYIRLDQKVSLGAKRNIALAHSQGDIIAHWDDDDWYHPSYVRHVTHRLIQAHDTHAIAGLICYLVYLLKDAVLKICQTSGIAGATLCYFRALWERQRYRDVVTAEDYFFIQDAKPHLLRIDDPELFVVIRHTCHTWKQERGVDVDSYLRRLKNHVKRLDDIVTRDDYHFYEAARHQLYTRKSRETPGVARAPEVPLVSCIMPTYNRRLFVPQAIQYFLRQDYPHRELVVIDDGSDAVADLIPPQEQIRYIRLDQRVSIGRKRNLAVEQSKGKIIVHWDDDDWYAADRISYQIKPLLDKKAEVCGLETGFIYDMIENTFWSCEAHLHAMMFYADIHGGSIMYTRELWERYAKYPDISLAEDAHFLRAISNKARITKLPNRNVFIYLRHNSNAWEFICGTFINPNAWKRIPPPGFLSQGDQQFYHDVLAKLLLDANTHKAKGDSFRHARRYREALPCYERAIELDPTHVWAWYDKGQTLEKLGHYDTALQAVREADRLLHPQDGNRTWIHSELGTLFLLLGDKQQAHHQFETALRCNAQNHIARDGLRRL